MDLTWQFCLLYFPEKNLQTLSGDSNAFLSLRGWIGLKNVGNNKCDSISNHDASSVTNYGRKKICHKWTHNDTLILKVQIVPPDTYPDLICTPTNPFNQMSDEDRLQDFIEYLGLLWAETCRQQAPKEPAGNSENMVA